MFVCLCGGVAGDGGALYEKLPHGRRGPGGLTGKQVAADQRRRLFGGMVQAVAREGYEASTVAEVCALAGVSKKTLYRHFPSKQACFLSTYDAVVGEAVGRISAAYAAAQRSVDGGPARPATPLGQGGAGESDWRAGLCAAFEAFVAEIVARPRAAWLALVEALAVGPAALGRIERGEATFMRMIAQSLARAPDGATLSPVLVRGVVHGLWYVARTRLLEGRAVEMAGAGEELLEWMLSYRVPAALALDELGACEWGGRDAESVGGSGDDLGAGARGRAPVASGARAGLASSVGGSGGGTWADERTRMALAAAQIAARGGYRSLTGTQIAKRAGVEHERFQRLFGDVQECFLAAVELLSAQALAGALREARGAPDWPAAVCRAVEGLLGHVAREPVFARVGFVEIFATGPAGVRRRAARMGGFAQVLARRAPAAARPSPLVAEAIAGAVWGIVHHEVVHGRAGGLETLGPHAAYLALAPVLGGETAVLEIERAAGRARRGRTFEQS